MSTQVHAIVSGLIQFCGSTLVSESDIQGVIGNHVSPEKTWLANFVIDDYLELIKQSCTNDIGVNVQTIKWELFEKGDVATLVKESDSCQLMNQDLILIPCNAMGSTHWFLMAVLPQKKVVLALDSISGNFLKPTVEARLNKMAEVLATINPTQQLD